MIAMPVERPAYEAVVEALTITMELLLAFREAVGSEGTDLPTPVWRKLETAIAKADAEISALKTKVSKI